MRRATIILLISATVALTMLVGIAPAQNDVWGDVSGIVLYFGPAIVPKPAAPAVEGCTATVWPAPVVHPKNKGLEGVFVWLEPAKKDGDLPIHESLKKVPQQAIVIDQRACDFFPRFAAIREGQSLITKNTSSNPGCFKWTGHPGANPGGNLILAPGEEKELKDLVQDRLPIKIECSVHPWKNGAVRVFKHPYFALTDDSGKFTIKNAPAGQFTIKYWHGDLGWPGGDGGKKGFPLTIENGENTLKSVSYQ